MTEADLAKATQRPSILPILLTSLGVFGFLVAYEVLGFVLRVAREVVYGGGLPGQGVPPIGGIELVGAFAGPLFFAIGVFISLWLLAPISGDHPLGGIVVRAVFATALGAACVAVFRFFGELIYIATTPELRTHPELLGGAAFDAATDSLSTLAGWLPLVVLGAVLFWMWLRRYPLTEPVSSTLDEV